MLHSHEIFLVCDLSKFYTKARHLVCGAYSMEQDKTPRLGVSYGAISDQFTYRNINEKLKCTPDTPKI